MKNLVSGDGESRCAFPDLLLIRRSAPTLPEAYLYEPSLAVILSGKKRVHSGGRIYEYDSSRYLMTSVNLPTVTEVSEATTDLPYLSLLFRLDLELVRKLIAEGVHYTASSRKPAGGIATAEVSTDLLEAIHRFVRVISRPEDLRHLGPAVFREIHYRTLTGPMGSQLVQIVDQGTSTERIAQVIRWLGANVARRVRVEELAIRAGMGASTFFHHFRRITGTSPLQYQKLIRLHRARGLLLKGDHDVGSVALEVGYESVSQFGREYRRMFHESPGRDRRSAAPSPGAASRQRHPAPAP